MNPLTLLKHFDILFSQYLLDHLPKKIGKRQKETLLLTFCLGNLGGIEDRVGVYFDLLAEAEPVQKIRFKRLVVRRFLPSSFFAILIFFYHLIFNVSLLLIDYNTASRIPTLRSLKRLSMHLKVCFVWFESFEAENALRRIKPCLFDETIHIIADDPQLRLLDIPEFQSRGEFFRFFPAPFFPKKYFFALNLNPRSLK